MNRPSDELLMRYVDGDLSEAEAEELERRLETDPEAASIVAGLEQVGDVVRAVGERHGERAGDIAGAVLARIDAEQRSESEAPPASGPRPLPGWTFPAIAAGLAAAAAAAIWLATPSGPPPVARAIPTVQPQPLESPGPTLPPPEPPEAMTEEDAAPSVAIEAVDFGSHNGAIFMVSAGDEATPVVWLTDDVAEGGDRTEPL